MKQLTGENRTYTTMAVLFFATLAISMATISLSLLRTYAAIEDNDMHKDSTSSRKASPMAISGEKVYLEWPAAEALTTSTPNSTSSMNANKVSMISSGKEGYVYQPNTTQVKVEDTVSWTNDDDTLHTVTSGSGTDENAGASFDSGMMGAGKIFEHTFTRTGEYPYFCIVHPDMIGKVIVS
jgi:plastocyanin